MFPEFLPGGKALLFTIRTGKATGSKTAPSPFSILAPRKHQVLVQGGSQPRYAATGTWLSVGPRPPTLSPSILTASRYGASLCRRRARRHSHRDMGSEFRYR